MLNITTSTIPGFVLVILLAIAATYLVFVGLAAVLIWAFSLTYNPWVMGLGIWAIVLLGRAIFRRS